MKAEVSLQTSTLRSYLSIPPYCQHHCRSRRETLHGEPVEKISSTAPMNADSLKGTQQSMITSTAWKLHACRKLCIQAPPRSLTENHPWTQGGFIWASSPSQVGYTPELSSGTVCVGNSKVYRPVKPLNSSHYMVLIAAYAKLLVSTGRLKLRGGARNVGLQRPSFQVFF